MVTKKNQTILHLLLRKKSSQQRQKNLGIFCLKLDDNDPIIKSIDLKDKKMDE